MTLTQINPRLWTTQGDLCLVVVRDSHNDGIWSYSDPSGDETRGTWSTSTSSANGDASVLELEVTDGSLSDTERERICRAMKEADGLGIDTWRDA